MKHLGKQNEKMRNDIDMLKSQMAQILEKTKRTGTERKRRDLSKEHSRNQL
jgi:hypothetical protein